MIGIALMNIFSASSAIKNKTRLREQRPAAPFPLAPRGVTLAGKFKLPLSTAPRGVPRYDTGREARDLLSV
jgi:hypothetical protein